MLIVSCDCVLLVRAHIHALFTCVFMCHVSSLGPVEVRYQYVN